MKYIDQLAWHQGTVRSGPFTHIVEIGLVIDLVEIPVGSAHLETSTPRLHCVPRFAIANDVGEVEATMPVFRASL